MNSLHLPLLFAGALLVATSPCRSQQPRGDDDSLRVLVWNIQRGANQFEQGPEKALAVIRAARPHVCLLQESYDIDGERPTLGQFLADQLGWTAWQGKSPHLCVLTRLEVRERFEHAPWHGVGARLADDAGREVLAWSTWIDYRSYAPYALRDDPDITDAELLACEAEKSGRLKQAEALLAELEKRGQLAAQIPLLVGGDWNCPSHLDWTEDTARVFRFRRSLRLPVSLAMQEAGFADTFRAVHPDPVQHPGLTWSPLHRGTADEPVPHDRIDRLYLRRSIDSSSAPRLEPVTAEVLPNGWEPMSVEPEQRKFPSDHGAVVIDFAWR